MVGCGLRNWAIALPESVGGASRLPFHPFPLPAFVSERQRVIARVRCLVFLACPPLSPLTSPAFRLCPKTHLPLVFGLRSSLFPLKMASSCASVFSSRTLNATGAFLTGASDVYLLQCVNSVGTARQGLLGSLLRCRTGGWAYVPLEESSLVTRKGALCVVVRPSSGHAGKEVPVMDLGIAFSGIRSS